MPKARLLSGIQPTGGLHVGNYLGAIQNWVRLQDEYECLYSVVDLHAMTIPYEPGEMPARVFEAAAMLLASGIDPARATVFVQSDVPEHSELAWILSCVTPLGELERLTQFKEKSEEHKKSVNLGLLSYPVLQAADILLYKAEVVPVGEDQVQHLEISREIARRFNARFGPVFPEPRALLTRTPRVMGVDGQAKMSKSKGNGIMLRDEPAKVRALLKTAATDPARVRRQDPGNPDVCNVYTMHKGLSTEATLARVDRECRTAAIGCIECKTLLADAMVPVLDAIRTKADGYDREPARLREVLSRGAAHCREIAGRTMDEVRRATGLRRS
ncbi:MAG: tryptophan--tRNA ligase [Planctomycetales bacterium]|nr:tryptophan--tRNA ligase [Planctomycetales bacterium]